MGVLHQSKQLLMDLWKHPVIRGALGWWLAIGIYWYAVVAIISVSQQLDRQFWWPFAALYMIGWLLPPLATLGMLIYWTYQRQWRALAGMIGAIVANSVILAANPSTQSGWLALSLWPFYLR